MFVVTTKNHQTGNRFFLRGTIWTGERARAQLFASEAAAYDAIKAAAKFTKPRVFARTFTTPSVVAA